MKKKENQKSVWEKHFMLSYLWIFYADDFSLACLVVWKQTVCIDHQIWMCLGSPW